MLFAWARPPDSEACEQKPAGGARVKYFTAAAPAVTFSKSSHQC